MGELGELGICGPRPATMHIFLILTSYFLIVKEALLHDVARVGVAPEVTVGQLFTLPLRK